VRVRDESLISVFLSALLKFRGLRPECRALQYAPRAVLLLSGEKNVAAVMPMEFTTNGQQHLEFVPASQIKISMQKGGKPILLGDVLSALGDATQTINQLQAQVAALKAENEKLWKVAIKNNPSQPPPTIVVQQPPPQTHLPSPAEIEAAQKEARRQRMLAAWMMLQNRSQPQNYNMHVTISDCTRLPALCVGR
jgi:hypothetical protein